MSYTVVNAATGGSVLKTEDLNKAIAKAKECKHHNKYGEFEVRTVLTLFSTDDSFKYEKLINYDREVEQTLLRKI
jgi:hypothetical protein